jgi:hypothetical protein
LVKIILFLDSELSNHCQITVKSFMSESSRIGIAHRAAL